MTPLLVIDYFVWTCILDLLSGWQLTGNRVVWEWNMGKPSLERRGRETRWEPVRGPLQSGALGSMRT